MTDLKLSSKFTLLLGLVFLGGIIISGAVLWQALQRRAQVEVTDKGLLLTQAMNSVRSYTSNHIRPLLADRIATEPEFILETVPAFSARSVFAGLRQNEAYASFFYKEATLNPTNPVNLADDFEAAIVHQMRARPSLGELSGYRTLNGERLYYTARPLAVASESCLACHSDPAAAPASLVRLYGQEGGFGWQVGEIVAAQFIYVPADEVFNAALRSFLTVLAIFVIAFAAAILALNLFLKRLVIQPVGIMGRLALDISEDKIEPARLEADQLQQVTRRTDELGQLAQVFRNMAREVYARTQTLKQQVQELRIEIDVIKRQQQVSEIVESDFFRDLQHRARQFRGEPGRPAGDDRATPE